ncbi:DUF742 domain-containing protein [Actinoplanes sp. CA-015351]|uniref:DUF742 domain-containing protein n=1 Tax=Actinoplanes sp. CA-015351 TaxID=3239897 RepID=UPI003D96B68B
MRSRPGRLRHLDAGRTLRRPAHAGTDRRVPPAPTTMTDERRPHPGPLYDKNKDPLVRPFMLTGGRTAPRHDGLRVETPLAAVPAALSAPLRFEARRIVELCQRPQSLADLAAALKVPLGVVRVIVGDLITDGHLRIEEQPDVLSVDLIERIRDRVRAL